MSRLLSRVRLHVVRLEDRTVPAFLTLVSEPSGHWNSTYNAGGDIVAYPPGYLHSYSFAVGTANDYNAYQDWIPQSYEANYPVPATSTATFTGDLTYRVVAEPGEQDGTPVNVRVNYGVTGSTVESPNWQGYWSLSENAELRASLQLRSGSQSKPLFDRKLEGLNPGVFLDQSGSPTVTGAATIETTIGGTFSISHSVNAQAGFNMTSYWAGTGNLVSFTGYYDLEFVPIRLAEATTLDFKKVQLEYKLSRAVSHPFNFRAYLSDDEKYSPDDTAVAVTNGTVSDPNRWAAGTHNYDLKLTQKVLPTKQRRFILVVADLMDQVGESADASLFVIPRFLPHSRVGFDAKTGAFRRPASELATSGPIWGRISRGTPDFDRLASIQGVWQESGRTFSLPDPVPYAGDDWRVDDLLVPAVTKLTELIELAQDQDRFKSTLLSLNDAFDEEGDHSNSALHYEGRAVDIQADQGEMMEKLTGLALLAGFDFAWNEWDSKVKRSHLHASAGYHGGDPFEAMEHHATVSTSVLRDALAWGFANNLILDPSLLDPLRTDSLIARLNRVDQYAVDTTLTLAKRKRLIAAELNAFKSTVIKDASRKDGQHQFAQLPKGFGVRGVKATQCYLVFTAVALKTAIPVV